MRTSIAAVAAMLGALVVTNSASATVAPIYDFTAGSLPNRNLATPATVAGGTNPVQGTNGRDVIFGTPNNDTIYDLGGNELLCGFGGHAPSTAGMDSTSSSAQKVTTPPMVATVTMRSWTAQRFSRLPAMTATTTAGTTS